MKKIVISLLLLSWGLVAGAQSFGGLQLEPECSEFIVKKGRGRAQQGLEMYKRYIFSLEDGGHVNVYDFKKANGIPIAGFELASSGKDNHANNAEFGIEKKRGASFPLMYISNGKVGSDIEWTCFVESIKRRGKKFSSELAQTIVLDISGFAAKGLEPIFGAPSWLIDRERKALWVFSAHQRTTPAVTLKAEDNFYIAYKFRIPALSEGPVVKLTADDLLQQVIFPFETWFTQAGCMYDGKIFYCYGVGKIDPENRPSRIRVYDTDSGTIVAKYNLNEEIPYEMEDLVIRDGWIYVNTNTSPKRGQGDPIIYKLSLPR
ncbi:MAG: hypothetical protein IKX67_08080 [Bacteroidales bacterium]|nr:hypothetical protein [Bacteroidales bacterium]